MGDQNFIETIKSNIEGFHALVQKEFKAIAIASKDPDTLTDILTIISNVGPMVATGKVDPAKVIGAIQAIEDLEENIQAAKAQG